MTDTTNQIENPIKPVGLFHTPANMKELQDILERYTGTNEDGVGMGAVANTAAFMAWNLASKLVEEALAEK